MGSLIRGMMRQRRAKKQPVETGGGARYSQFMTLAGGMSRLIDAMGDRLSQDCLRLNSPVLQMVAQGAKWSILSEHDPSQSEESDAVIIAAPARAASQMLSSVDKTISRELAGIEYASCAVVSLAFRRDQIGHPLGSFGFVVPLIENQKILSCSFSSEKYPGRAPDGTVLIRVFIGGACQGELLQQSNDQLIEMAHRETAQLLEIKGAPILQHITRQTQAMPQYHVGHQDRIAKINERLQNLPTLALAGSSLSGVGVPGCIESGQQAAERIATAIGLGSTQPAARGA